MNCLGLNVAKLRPYPHQATGGHLIAERKVAALWWFMRRGKTLATVLGLEELGARRVLVLCPKAVIPVWVKILTDYDFKVEGYSPNRKRRKTDCLVINYESVWRPKPAVDVSEYDAIVWDESIRLQNFKSKGVNWWFKQIPKFPEVRVMLSGAPCPESLLQIAPQLWILQGGATAYRGVFRNYVFRNWTWNEYAYKYEANNPAVEKKLENHMNKLGDTSANELELDVEKFYEELSVEPKHEQKKLFKEIYASEVAYNAEGKLVELTGNRRAQLLAMASSGIDARDPNNVRFTNSEKLEYMFQYIKDIVDDYPDEKFVIFTWFRHSPEIVKRRLEELGRCVVSVTGTSDEAIKEFQKGKTRFFIGNVKVNQEGIDLSLANNMYYFENSWSGGSRIQSEERCTRLDKKGVVQVIDFGTEYEGTNIDLKIASSVRDKRDFNADLLGL